MPTHDRVILFGGGHSLSAVLTHLQKKIWNFRAVVHVFDDGSHTGYLRKVFGMPAIGDLRRVILTLANQYFDPQLRELIDYRFDDRLDNTSIGNLLLAALWSKYQGDLMKVIEEFCKLVHAENKILPITLGHSTLCAELSDGSILQGESTIGKHDGKVSIVRAFLEPTAEIYPGVADCIRTADKIVFCPGSPWTSIVPHFLVNGFAEAVRQSNARFIQVVNLMIEQESRNFSSASDFVRLVHGHLGRNLDVVICNDGPIPLAAREKYKKEGFHRVVVDKTDVLRYSQEVICKNLVEVTSGGICHNDRLTRIITDL